jgi:hypothetical protein
MHNWKLAAEDIQVSDSLIHSDFICTRRAFSFCGMQQEEEAEEK